MGHFLDDTVTKSFGQKGDKGISLVIGGFIADAVFAKYPHLLQIQQFSGNHPVPQDHFPVGIPVIITPAG